MVLEQMKTDHQANGLAMTTAGAVIKSQGFVQLVPIDEFGRTHQFMVGI